MKIADEITIAIPVPNVQKNMVYELTSGLNIEIIHIIGHTAKQSQLIWKAKIPASSKTVSASEHSGARTYPINADNPPKKHIAMRILQYLLYQ